MMTKTQMVLLVSFLTTSMLSAYGCNDDDSSEGLSNEDTDTQPIDDDATKSGDAETASLSITGLNAFSGVDGVEKVAVSINGNFDVVKTELVVNHEVADETAEVPILFNWDTKQSNDGPIDLSVRATDAAGKTITSESVRVVVINNGIEFLDMEEGPLATMRIPPDFDGSQETHVKSHFTPGRDFFRAICVALWANPEGGIPWNMKADMGTGICPHSGISFEGFGLSNTGAVELDVEPEQGILKGKRHFCHVGAENAHAHVGESLEINYKIFLFYEAEEMTACPLNSTFPCRCDGVEKCADGSDCVGFRPDKNGGACALVCNGEEDGESCGDTRGFGLYGFCGAYKGDTADATHCVVVCEEGEETGSCPPKFNCDGGSGLCIPVY